MWKHLHHRNILPFLGIVYQGPTLSEGLETAYLVSSWMSHGDARTYIAELSSGSKETVSVVLRLVSSHKKLLSLRFPTYLIVKYSSEKLLLVFRIFTRKG